MKKTKSKPVSKRKVKSKKASPKKRVSRAVKKKAVKRKIAKKEVGYTPTKEGILVPDGTLTPVPPSKITAGLSKANKDITQLLDEIVSTMSDNYSISEIELSASFNADGKFLGIGIGGATSITIRVKPDSDL